VIAEEYLRRYQLSVPSLAEHLGLTSPELRELLSARRPVTWDLARRLGRALGTTAAYWTLQQLAWEKRRFEPPMPLPLLPDLAGKTDGLQDQHGPNLVDVAAAAADPSLAPRDGH
jgi:addiction module HigA family antidote